MFKKFSLFIVLAATLLAGQVQAGNRDRIWAQDRGKVLVDTVEWYASGALLGSKVRTDTLLGGTLEDTTYAVDYAGVQSMSITWITKAKGTDLDLIVYPYVSPDGYNTWRALTGYADFDSATPSRSNVARDTITQILYVRNAGIDTTTTTGATTGTAFVHPLGRDMRILETNRWLRFHVDPQMGASTDTVYLTGILTRIYPP